MKKTRGNDQRPTLLRLLDRIGLIEILVLAITAGLCIWAWLAFVVADEPDFESFTIFYGIVLAAGGTFHVVMLMYCRSSGSARARLSFGAPVREGVTPSGIWGNVFELGNTLMILAPVVVFAVTILILTPPTTPADNFDPDMGLYHVILLITMLGVVFTALGAGVITMLVVMPLALLVAAFLPKDRDIQGRTLPGRTSTADLVIMGSIVLASVGFALAVTCAPSQTSSSTRTARMLEQFVSFVTFSGNPVLTLIGWLCLAVIVSAVVADRRLNAKKRNPEG